MAIILQTVELRNQRKEMQDSVQKQENIARVEGMIPLSDRHLNYAADGNVSRPFQYLHRGESHWFTRQVEYSMNISDDHNRYCHEMIDEGCFAFLESWFGKAEECAEELDRLIKVKGDKGDSQQREASTVAYSACREVVHLLFTYKQESAGLIPELKPHFDRLYLNMFDCAQFARPELHIADEQKGASGSRDSKEDQGSREYTGYTSVVKALRVLKECLWQYHAKYERDASKLGELLQNSSLWVEVREPVGKSSFVVTKSVEKWLEKLQDAFVVLYREFEAWRLAK